MTTTPEREARPAPPTPPADTSAVHPAEPAPGPAPDVRGQDAPGKPATAAPAGDVRGADAAVRPGVHRATGAGHSAAGPRGTEPRGGDGGGPAGASAATVTGSGALRTADSVTAVDDPAVGGPADPGGADGSGGSGGGHGSGLPGGPGAAGAAALPPRAVPRWARWLVVPVLILVPLVYMLISAEQSRGAGVDSQKQAAARHLTWVVPSELQRRIYQVPIPDGTVHDGYLETNSWNVSTFYCQFTTTAGGLDTFLADLGTSRAALHEGKVTITPQDAGEVGWNFTVPRHHWAGLSTHKVGDKPDHDITVDLTHADTPVVYVVSTVNFQHGLGDGWIRRIVQ